MGLDEAAWRSQVQHITKLLEEDLKKTFDDWVVPCPAVYRGATTRKYYFLHPHLLVGSKYFGHYGVRVYELFCDRSHLEAITKHSDQRMQSSMRSAVFGGAGDPLLHMRRVPPLLQIPAEDVEAFRDMSPEALREYIRSRIKGCSLPDDVEVDREHTAHVLETFGRSGICVPPKERYFTEPQSHIISRELNLLSESAVFIERRIPRIPLYMRQVMLAETTRAATIMGRIARFKTARLPEAYYIHELHTSNRMERTIRSTRHVVQSADIIAAERARRAEPKPIRPDYERREAHLLWSLLRRYLSEDELPSEDELRGIRLPTIRNRILSCEARGEKITLAILNDDAGQRALAARRQRRAEEDRAAEEKLRELGYPLEWFTSEKISHLRSSTILRKVELMIFCLGKVNKTLIWRDEEVIRALGTKREKRVTARAELDEFCEERGAGAVPAYLLQRCPPATVLERLRYIEARGVPFKGESQWSWINMGRRECDRKIEVAWGQQNANDRMGVLLALYNVRKVPVGLLTSTPEHLWEYFRILMEAGLEPNDVALSEIHQVGLEWWREYLAQKLEKKKKHSPKQQLFANKYYFARIAEERFGWEDADTLLEGVSFEELTEIESASIKQSEQASAHYQRLQHRAQLREAIKEKLIFARASFADMDFFLDRIDAEEVMDRLRVFEEAERPVDVRLLYGSADQISKKLSDAQTGT